MPRPDITNPSQHWVPLNTVPGSHYQCTGIDLGNETYEQFQSQGQKEDPGFTEASQKASEGISQGHSSGLGGHSECWLSPLSCGFGQVTSVEPQFLINKMGIVMVLVLVGGLPEAGMGGKWFWGEVVRQGREGNRKVSCFSISFLGLPSQSAISWVT